MEAEHPSEEVNKKTQNFFASYKIIHNIWSTYCSVIFIG